MKRITIFLLMIAFSFSVIEFTTSSTERTYLPGKSKKKKRKKRRRRRKTFSKEQLILYEAVLIVEVNDVEDKLKKFKKLADENDGYMLSLSSNSLVLRIPSNDLEKYIFKIQEKNKIVTKKITSQNVSSQYYELKGKLKSAEKIRSEYIKNLKRVKSAGDSVIIETELERITAKIESYKGQLNFYEESSEYAKVTITVKSLPTGPQIPLGKLNEPKGPYGWTKYLGIDYLLDY